MILVIDNYDSFTYNLVQLLLSLGREVEVKRNDALSVAGVLALEPDAIVLSPGPGRPEDAGICVELLRSGAPVPILGVCLGHQCIGDIHGMTVTRHTVPMHGKTSPIHHDNQGVFRGLSNPFTATRYHSLVVLAETVPPLAPDGSGWTVSAWVKEDAGRASTSTSDIRHPTSHIVMGLRRIWPKDAPHQAPLEGVQFHPESFLTLEGPTLLKNFLNYASA